MEEHVQIPMWVIPVVSSFIALLIGFRGGRWQAGRSSEKAELAQAISAGTQSPQFASTKPPRELPEMRYVAAWILLTLGVIGLTGASAGAIIRVFDLMPLAEDAGVWLLGDSLASALSILGSALFRYSEHPKR